ncbi:methylmalonyl-CoA mutase family protein [Nocardioides sp.]|uniref:methylmalonyl-CoA mutase family protein n=1 Tax=Nocardioides sp. TaxID=35761 RepID=UPI003514BBFE
MTSQEKVGGAGAADPEEGPLRLQQPQDDHARSDWERETAAVLRKGRRLAEDAADDAVWATLTRTTLDGVPITPLGTPDLVESLVTAGRPTREGAWDVRSALGPGVTDAVRNEESLAELETGATSLWLTVDADTDFATLLRGVFLDLAPVVLETRDAAGALAAARAYLAHLAAEHVTAHAGTNLGVPAELAGTPEAVEVATAARQAGILAFVVDGTAVHDRGASDAQELGHVLRVGAEYLRALTGAGLDVATAASLVEFRLAATDEQFPTIAKLRAVRRLWARVLELSGVAEPAPMRLHVVTSRPMMSRYDPYVNMLRGTVAAFAAGVAGADALTVLPFDAPLGRPEAFGRRIARNTSALLIEESHVAVVTDPAGGSYHVEKLTDDVAVAGWTFFGELEAGASLDDAVAATVAERDRLVATRARPITGLTEFPNLAEELPQRTPDGLFDAVRSYGASFEALRDAPASQPVFLATLGPIAAHTARATFASNLFAAGGIGVEVAGATADADALVAAYGGQSVVCLAGADTAYAAWGQAAAEALRAAGATHVIIAGKPTDYADDSCAMGLDALAFLTRTREKLS